MTTVSAIIPGMIAGETWFLWLGKQNMPGFLQWSSGFCDLWVGAQVGIQVEFVA